MSRKPIQHNRTQTSALKMPSLIQMQALLAPFNQKNYTQAINDSQTFIKQFPRHPFGYKLLGACYEHQSNFDLAVVNMEKAALLQPKDAENLSNLAKVYKDLGRLSDALNTYQKALALAPDNVDILGKYIFLLNYFNKSSPEHALQSAKRYGLLLSEQAATHRFSTWHNRDSANPIIHIGFVSGDLRQHPVGFFLENVLTELMKHPIHVSIYTTQTHNEDDLTQRLKKSCHMWQSIALLDDTRAAQLIHADKIDILFDLSGLSAFHRLGVFAHKPAPMQISWLGYFATTGLPEMDYVLADEHSISTTQEAHFSEKIIRLPHTRLCYGGQHMSHAPTVSSLPALENNYITIGCFQNLSKITDDVLSLWGEIFKEIPNACLYMQNKQLSSINTQINMRARLKKQGISANRVVMHGLSDFDNYLAAHNQVDFILDTFPFPGGTTTCEALWMGVPTLTLQGEQMISRQGQSLLQAAGLPDWIAKDKEEYKQKAISFADSSAALASLRSTLRLQVQQSPLFNAPLFAKDFFELCMHMMSKL